MNSITFTAMKQTDLPERKTPDMKPINLIRLNSMRTQRLNNKYINNNNYYIICVLFIENYILITKRNV